MSQVSSEEKHSDKGSNCQDQQANAQKSTAHCKVIFCLESENGESDDDKSGKQDGLKNNLLLIIAADEANNNGFEESEESKKNYVGWRVTSS